MTEYIKKEDALFAFYRLYVVPKSDDSEKYMQQIEDIHNDIKKLPAADVVEQKHGKLLTNEFGYERCSVCNYGLMLFITDENNILRKPNFCPNCGAIMDGDQ